MRKLEELQEQIRNLSAAELAEFRKWYVAFDARAWDIQFEADVKAAKLDTVAYEARRAGENIKSTKA